MHRLHLLIVAAIAGLAATAALLAQPGSPQQQNPERPLPQERLNRDPVKPSINPNDWVGLKCRIYLRTDASSANARSSISPAGLGAINDTPLFAQGVLNLVGDDALVITGPNGHVWIPRDQVRIIEIIQNPSTEKSLPEPRILRR